MAYERLSDVKIKGSDLDAFVDGSLKMYERQLAARNADDEMRFNKFIVDENLSLENQLLYRQSQLKRISDDPEERKRISTEILNLKERIEQKTFSDAYTDKLISYESGISSVDSVLDWLGDRLANATDISLKETIRKSILEKQKEKFALTQKILQSQTEYAIKDKSESILDNQISKVSAKRNEAILSGNNDLIDVYDLQLQALNKAKTEFLIENTIKNFAVSTIAGSSSSTGLLDAYNSKISSASSNTPITISGTTYASEREFWTYKRDSYVADTSASGFFTRFNNEQNNNIKIKNSQNTLSVGDINSSSSAYNSLLSRPELQSFINNVNIYKQDSIQTATDLLATKIYNQYLNDYDINKALNAIENIKTSGGANTQDIYTKILTKNAELKTQQVGNILETAANISPTGKATSGTVTAASSQGAGGIISPTQAAGKTAEQIAQESVQGAANKAFGTETRTTTSGSVTPAAPPIVPPKTPAATPASTVPSPTLLINKQLDFGMTDAQVKELQKFLNKQGFLVSSSGAGSPGSETEYFGPATQAALQKFQKAQGIVSTGTATTTGYGRLGPQTLTAIQKLLK